MSKPPEPCFKSNGKLNEHAYDPKDWERHRHYRNMPDENITHRSANKGVIFTIERGSDIRDARGNKISRSLDSFIFKMRNCYNGEPCQVKGLIDGNCALTAMRVDGELVTSATTARDIRVKMNAYINAYDKDVAADIGCAYKPGHHNLAEQ